MHIGSIHDPADTQPAKDRILTVFKSWGLRIHMEKSKIPKRVDSRTKIGFTRDCVKSQTTCAFKKLVSTFRECCRPPKTSSIYKRIFKSIDINYFNALINDTVDDIDKIHNEYKRLEKYYTQIT